MIRPRSRQPQLRPRDLASSALPRLGYAIGLLGGRQAGSLVSFDDSSGGSRHDAVVDEDQRRGFLLEAEDEARRVGREFGWDSPQATAWRQRQLGLERSTAAQLGLPYAQRFSVGVEWGATTPMPVLLSGQRTFVIVHHCAGAQVTRDITVVEFKRVASLTIGLSNEEVLRRHNLWGSGLEIHSAHEVMNSPRVTELMELNRGHELFDERLWRGKRHFLLTFRDATLECIANRTIARTVLGATMADVLARLSLELL